VVGLDERFAMVENGTHHHAQREHVGENAAYRRRLHLWGCKQMQIGRISRRERLLWFAQARLARINCLRSPSSQFQVECVIYWEMIDHRRKNGGDAGYMKKNIDFLLKCRSKICASQLF
jgi:hypothetical protein